jgi:hypothetical protein
MLCVLLILQGGGEFTSLQVAPDAASYQLLVQDSSSSRNATTDNISAGTL